MQEAHIVAGCSVPKWEELGHTPAVFARVANKGLVAYVKWKSAEAIENKETKTVASGEWREGRKTQSQRLPWMFWGRLWKLLRIKGDKNSGEWRGKMKESEGGTPPPMKMDECEKKGIAGRAIRKWLKRKGRKSGCST